MLVHIALDVSLYPRTKGATTSARPRTPITQYISSPSVLVIASLALSPNALSITSDVSEVRAMREVKLQNRDLVGRQLNELMLPGDAMVLMIERMGDVVIPDRATALRANDIVTLIGTDDDVDHAARLFARNGSGVLSPSTRF